jgi:Uma2 family endonuclease
MIAITQNHFSADDYLQRQEQHEYNHEYVDGQIYAMAGASENHYAIYESVDLSELNL